MKESTINRRDITPVNGWVLIQRDDATKSDGGLHLPESAQKATAASKGATVIAVSLGTWIGGVFVEPAVKLGDRVWMHGQARVQTLGFDEDVALVHQEDFCCVVESSKVTH